MIEKKKDKYIVGIQIDTNQKKNIYNFIKLNCQIHLFYNCRKITIKKSYINILLLQTKRNADNELES